MWVKQSTPKRLQLSSKENDEKFGNSKFYFYLSMRKIAKTQMYTNGVCPDAAVVKKRPST
jgi:hypothetical protein